MYWSTNHFVGLWKWLKFAWQGNYFFRLAIDKKINAVEWVLSKFYPKRAIFDGKGTFFV